MKLFKYGLQLSLFVIVEIFLFKSYNSADANFHWFTHFFAGTVFALLLMAIITLLTRRAFKLPLLWITLSHLFAMFPDIQFNNAHIAHNVRYDDYFLFHIQSHFMPGRNVTWYVLTMLSLGLYVTAINKIQSNTPSANA